MMWPRLRWTIPGRNAWVICTKPLMLVSIMVCQSSICARSAGSSPSANPELLIRTSTSKKSCGRDSGSFGRVAGARTSSCRGNNLGPNSSARDCKRSLRRAAAMTELPAFTKALAVAAPMPLDAPVISTSTSQSTHNRASLRHPPICCRALSRRWMDHTWQRSFQRQAHINRIPRNGNMPVSIFFNHGPVHLRLNILIDISVMAVKLLSQCIDREGTRILERCNQFPAFFRKNTGKLGRCFKADPVVGFYCFPLFQILQSMTKTIQSRSNRLDFDMQNVLTHIFVPLLHLS